MAQYGLRWPRVERKPRRHMFLSQFWSAKKIIFFFIWAVFFEIIRKWPKFKKKTKTNFAVIGRLIELFGPSLALETPRGHQKGRKNPKNFFWVILDHLKKNEFFRFWPRYPLGNAIITVILAILANFTILKHASKKTERHIFAKNILFD